MQARSGYFLERISESARNLGDEPRNLLKPTPENDKKRNNHFGIQLFSRGNIKIGAVLASLYRVTTPSIAIAGESGRGIEGGFSRGPGMPICTRRERFSAPRGTNPGSHQDPKSPPQKRDPVGVDLQVIGLPSTVEHGSYIKSQLKSHN